MLQVGFFGYFCLAIVTLVLIRTLKWLVDYVNYIRVINKMEGMPILPFIGNMHQISFIRDGYLDMITGISKKFSHVPIFRFWTGMHPLIIFHKAEHLEPLLSSSKNIEKSVEYKFLQPWLGTGLLTSGGTKWQNRRRLLTPTFHFDILNDFMQVMNEQAEILVDILNELYTKKESIDIFQRLGLCTLDIICETAMGQNVNAQREKESNYVKAVGKLSEMLMKRFNTPYYWPEFIFHRTTDGKIHDECLKILHDFTRRVIIERSEEFEQSNVKTQKRIAFLDMLLKAKAEDATLTFNDIQEEVDTFMFEGHDTTAVAASWAVHMIGSHPDVQKKLHAEVDQVFGSSNRQLKSEDLGELKYLECVIKETLRLFPSVPFHGRILTEEQTIGGYTMPVGSTTAIFTYMVHRDERYYPDPEKFNPDRFLPENSADRNPYAFIPFSAGKRNCIGQRFALMEEKIILANILRRFEVKSLKTTEQIRPGAEIILRPIYGIPISLKLRNQA